MKYLILALIITGLFGCKKDDEYPVKSIEIISFNCKGYITIGWNEKAIKGGSSQDGGGGSAWTSPKLSYKFNTQGRREYDINVYGDSDNFSCKLLINGQNVYHQNGSKHNFKFK